MKFRAAMLFLVLCAIIWGVVMHEKSQHNTMRLLTASQYLHMTQLDAHNAAAQSHQNELIKLRARVHVLEDAMANANINVNAGASGGQAGGNVGGNVEGNVVASGRAAKVGGKWGDWKGRHKPGEMVMCTGASPGFFGRLPNLVGSIHYWAPGRTIVIYSLGLTPDQIEQMKTWKDVLVRWDDEEHQKDPIMANLMTYAFKPVAMQHAVEEFGAAFWLDAGCDVRGPLEDIENYLLKDGHFFVKGQDLDMTGRAAPTMFEYFGVDVEKYRGKPHYAGGVAAWIYGSETHQKIMGAWCDCAREPACIAPPGSSLGNHRYDQSALSVLLYSWDAYNYDGPQDHTELLAYTRSQLSSDPHEPSTMVIYTARGSSSDYVNDLRKK